MHQIVLSEHVFLKPVVVSRFVAKVLGKVICEFHNLEGAAIFKNLPELFTKELLPVVLADNDDENVVAVLLDLSCHLVGVLKSIDELNIFLSIQNLYGSFLMSLVVVMVYNMQVSPV